MVAHDQDADVLPGLPTAPVDRWTGPLARFMHVEAAGGVVLLVATVIAVAAANSVASEWFLKLWKTEVGFTFGSFSMMHKLQHWINDGLMAVFFFVIGLEVKRELVLGELRDLRQAVLPTAAALGGMIVPAGIYLAFQAGESGSAGWGIPMATDIAFVVGCLAILGSRVPRSLRVMLLTLAIVDDIGAILVIAIGYTEHLDWAALGFGVAGIGVILLLARMGVRAIGVYTFVGALVWLGFHESGVHATIAGVIVGLLTPATSWVSKGLLGDITGGASQVFHGEGLEAGISEYQALRHIETASREAISPLERLETTLHPWVGFVIMPIFALANAGVPFAVSDLGEPVSIAVVAGLLLGKPLGIVLLSWLAVKSGLARLPEGVSWGMIVAGGILAGIGFTMAMFIAGLALKDPQLLQTAKVGIFVGSGLSALIGLGMLFVLTNKVATPDP